MPLNMNFERGNANGNLFVEYQSVFMIDHLSNLENISVENLEKNGGTLGLSFYDMLKVLNKHNINPEILVLQERFQKPIGYCMFYKHGNNIQISHICLKNEYQAKGLANKFIDYLKRYYPKYITADIAYTNWKSKVFFNKAGFYFEDNPGKKRWRAILQLKEIKT